MGTFLLWVDTDDKIDNSCLWECKQDGSQAGASLCVETIPTNLHSNPKNS
jgi:hypothetical protein